MSIINTTRIMHDTTLWIRDLLTNNITDPISSRAGTSEFVETKYPDRDTQYPCVTVNNVITGDRTAGIGTESRFTEVMFEIRVWAKSVLERDNLADSIYNTLTSHQLDYDESALHGLHNLKITSMVDIDEEGSAGLHSKIIEGSYVLLAGESTTHYTLNQNLNTTDDVTFNSVTLTGSPILLATNAVTKEYVDNTISGENLWNRTGSILYPYNTGDSISGLSAIYSTGSVVGDNLTLTIPYNPFDQSLNTTDNVAFNSVSADSVGANYISSKDSADLQFNIGQFGEIWMNGYAKDHAGNNMWIGNEWIGTVLSNRIATKSNGFFNAWTLDTTSHDWLYPYFEDGINPVTTYITIPPSNFDGSWYGGLTFYNETYDTLFGVIDGITGDLYWRKNVYVLLDLIATGNVSGRDVYFYNNDFTPRGSPCNSFLVSANESPINYWYANHFEALGGGNGVGIYAKGTGLAAYFDGNVLNIGTHYFGDTNSYISQDANFLHINTDKVIDINNQIQMNNAQPISFMANNQIRWWDYENNLGYDVTLYRAKADVLATDDNFQVASDKAFYFGDTVTEGSGRIRFEGLAFIFEIYQSGAWVETGRIGGT